MTTREERETLQRFTEQYSGELTDVAQAIEGVVIGESWGVSGYTTMMQADRLGEVLTLQPGTNLLDLGAGRGWPGLYLAASTGCRAVLTDIPLEGLRSAIGRAGREHLSDQVAVVAASARAVPFRAGAFDAVVHTDMLCWLRAKLSVLRVSRQVLRPGGLTAFFTIHPAPGLSAQARTRAHRSGPVAVATSRAHRELLTLAGFTDIFEQDCTTEFHEVARAWIDQSDEHRDALADALGAPVFEERQTERRALLRAIEDGLLCRTLFVAVRPDPLRQFYRL